MSSSTVIISISHIPLAMKIKPLTLVNIYNIIKNSKISYLIVRILNEPLKGEIEP